MAPPTEPATPTTAETSSQGTRARTTSTREQASQTARDYVFTAAELRDLLIRYEHLVYQEAEARHQRVPHEPALPTVRRALRDRKAIPMDLVTAKPLAHLPQFYDHEREKEWVTYNDSDNEEGMDEEDLEDLLLNADRDLTDEELARLCQ